MTNPVDDPIDEEEFVLLNHMLDDTLTEYLRHNIRNYTPAEQAQLIYTNYGLRSLTNDDLISLIAVMAVRLFETGTATPPEA